jgi:signal transduction histidine kinase
MKLARLRQRFHLKVGTRLFLVLALPLAVLIAVFAMVEDRANQSRSRDEVVREGRAIARTVQLATGYALRDGQLEDLRTLVNIISDRESILGIRVFDAAGQLIYSPAGLRDASVPPADVLRRRMRVGSILEERFKMDGRPVIAWLAPLPGPDGRLLGASEVLQLESFVEEDAAASSRAIAVFAAVLIALVAVVVFVATRLSVARPIEELVGSVRGVALGTRSARVPERRSDELGRLAREFNVMCERLEEAHQSRVHAEDERRRAEARLHEAQRLASIGRFAAGLAHEIGTPLNVISGRAESLLRRAAPEAGLRRGLQTIVDQIERVSRIVGEMLDFARTRELRLAPTDLSEVLDDVIELVGEGFAAHGLRIDRLAAAGIPLVPADRERLQQVFLNLAMNAGDAMSSGGRLRIGMSVRETSGSEGAASCVAVRFEDTGRGIAPEHLSRVFDPFFTTKEVGKGTGLGLSVAYSIVREHGGWIEVESPPGKGTSVTVFLPCEEPVARFAPIEAAS